MTYFSALFGTTGATTTTSTGGWIGTQSSATTTGYANSIMQTQMLQAQVQIQAQLYLQQSQAGALYQQQADIAPWPRQLTEGEYELPDGAKLVVDSSGSYQVLDETAKVVYRACRVREFNPYINASDLLEAFIREVGKLDGVDQSDVLGLPIEAFINWIVLQAAKRDGDSLDDLPSVEAALVKRAIPHIPASTEAASAP